MSCSSESGAGKSRRAEIAVAADVRSRSGSATARFFDVIGLVDHIEAEARAGVAAGSPSGRPALISSRLDELRSICFRRWGGQFCST